MNPITLKEEARAEFGKRFRAFMGRPSEGGIELTHNNVRDFLNEVIDRTYHATKEEWLLKLNDEYAKGMSAGMKIGKKNAKEEVREELCRAIEMGRISGNFDVLLHSVTEYYLALEDTTTSPTN